MPRCAYNAMAPLPSQHHGVLPRDPPSPDTAQNQNQLSMSPSLIVGICILAGIFFCVLLASVIRLCSRRGAGPDTTENLFKPHDPSQIARLQEVKRINNKMAWERGQWARVELIKQGRRMTGMGGDSWESLENGYDVARQSLHPSPRQHVQGPYRDSHLTVSDVNPYARASRVSKMMRARRTKHRADDSDDEDDIDMEAFPHLPGLPAYAIRKQERLRRTPGGSSDESKTSSGKSKERLKAPKPQVAFGDSQTYLGPAIAKMSSGLDDGNRQARPPQVQQPHVRSLTPEPSPTQATRLLQSNPADFESISLSHQAGVGGPVSPVSDDVKSDTTIKARPISYQEDYNTITSPANQLSSVPGQSPARDNTVIHHGEYGRGRQGPIIMINDDTHDSEASARRVFSEKTNEYPYPMVNIGREAGAGDINEMEVFEPREAGLVGGRYYNTGAGRAL